MISLHASQQEHTCTHARATQMQTRKKGNAYRLPLALLAITACYSDGRKPSYSLSSAEGHTLLSLAPKNQKHW